MIENGEQVACEACGLSLIGLDDEGACPRCHKLYSAWVQRARQTSFLAADTAECPNCGEALDPVEREGACAGCRRRYRFTDAVPWIAINAGCPKCGYDLSGVSDRERCPECGTAFESMNFDDLHPGSPLRRVLVPPSLLRVHLAAGGVLVAVVVLLSNAGGHSDFVPAVLLAGTTCAVFWGVSSALLLKHLGQSRLAVRQLGWIRRPGRIRLVWTWCLAVLGVPVGLIGALVWLGVILTIT